MECVILVRRSDGTVQAIMDGDRIATFASIDDAITCADSHILCGPCPYQIVELDEL